MSIVIKQLQLEDFEGVRKVDEQTQLQYLGEKWNQFTQSERKNNLISRKNEFQINVETGYGFVAVKDTEIVGFIFAYETLPFRGSVYIRHIAILPALQGQSIGVYLYKAVINQAKDTGIKKIWSLINTDNPKSIKLHQKIGFSLRDRKEATIDLIQSNI